MSVGPHLFVPRKVKQAPAGRRSRHATARRHNHHFGYFSEHFSHHDFMLGRQNCYLFVRDWFVLPCDWNIRATPDPDGLVEQACDSIERG